MKLLSILRKDLLILVRSHAEMAVLFLMPLAFIIPISLALGRGDGYGINSENHMIPLPVINQDGGPRAQDLLASIGEGLLLENHYTEGQIKSLDLENDPACSGGDFGAACQELAAKTLVSRSRRIAMLIIPPGFSASVNKNEAVEIQLLYDPAADTAQYQMVVGVIQGAATRLSVQNRVADGMVQLQNLLIFAPEDVRQSIEDEISQPVEPDQKSAVNLQKTAPKNYITNRFPDTYQQTIPGYTVMYVFFIITSMSGSIRQEKLNGTFRRLLSSPTSRSEILGGKILASMVVGVIQVTFLFLVGVMLFGLKLGNDPLAFFLLTIALVLSAACLGLAASTFSKAGFVMAAPLIIAALLGGCMFPVDLMPPFLRTLSLAVPHSWALHGYQNLMVRGLGIQDVLPQIGMLLLFSAIFFLFAVWRFRFDE